MLPCANARHPGHLWYRTLYFLIKNAGLFCSKVLQKMPDHLHNLKEVIWTGWNVQRWRHCCVTDRPQKLKHHINCPHLHVLMTEGKWLDNIHHMHSRFSQFKRGWSGLFCFFFFCIKGRQFSAPSASIMCHRRLNTFLFGLHLVQLLINYTLRGS